MDILDWLEAVAQAQDMAAGGKPQVERIERTAAREIVKLRAELEECKRDAERYRTALEQIVAPFEDLNFVSGNKPLTYIYYVATDALAAKGSE